MVVEILDHRELFKRIAIHTQDSIKNALEGYTGALAESLVEKEKYLVGYKMYVSEHVSMIVREQNLEEGPLQDIIQICSKE